MRPLRSLLWLGFGCFVGGMLVIAADRFFSVPVKGGRLAGISNLPMEKRA